MPVQECPLLALQAQRERRSALVDCNAIAIPGASRNSCLFDDRILDADWIHGRLNTHREDTSLTRQGTCNNKRLYLTSTRESFGRVGVPKLQLVIDCKPLEGEVTSARSEDLRLDKRRIKRYIGGYAPSPSRSDEGKLTLETPLEEW